MTSGWPEAIVCEETSSGGMRYRLPLRTESVAGHAGRGLAGMGGCLLAFPILGSLFFLVFGLLMGGGMPWFIPLLPLGFFGIVCFPVGLILVRRGMCGTAGTCTVVVDEGRLRCVDRWGWFRRSRARRLSGLRGFRVCQGGWLPGMEDGPPLPDAPWRIEADFTGRQPLILAEGYPKDWLLELATDLGQRCRDERTVGLQALVNDIPVVEDSATAGLLDRTTQPTNSDAVLSEWPGGLLIHLPASGVRHGNPTFLLVWSLFWNAITWPLSIAFLALIFGGGNAQNVGFGPVGTVLFFTPFWAIGIGSLLVLLHRGLRRATIHVAGDELEIVEKGIVRRRRHRWTAPELDTVAAVGVPPALRFQPRDAPSVSLLSWRASAELEWVATLLRDRLRLKPPESVPLPAEEDEDDAELDEGSDASSSPPEAVEYPRPLYRFLGGVVSLAIFAGLVYLVHFGKVPTKTVVAYGFLVVGGIFVVIGLALLAWVAWVQRRSERTLGTVIALVPRQSTGEDGVRVTYAPKLRYRDQAGAVHEVESWMSSSPCPFQVGDVVPLLYDLTKPDRFLIDTFFQKWGLGLIVLTMGSVAVGVGVVVLRL